MADKDENLLNDERIKQMNALVFGTMQQQQPDEQGSPESGNGKPKKSRVPADPVIREAERVRKTVAQRLTRMDPKYRAVERRRNAEAQRNSRSDPEYRNVERIRRAIAQRVSRMHPAYHDMELSRNAQARRIARLDPEYRQVERTRNAQARRSARNGSSNGSTYQAEAVQERSKRSTRRNTDISAGTRPFLDSARSAVEKFQPQFRVMDLVTTLDEMLIDLVRNYPVIYMSSSDEQRRLQANNEREKAWYTVSMGLKERGFELDEKACRKRWSKLQKWFLFERSRKNMGVFRKRSKLARCYDAMAFLDAYWTNCATNNEPIFFESLSDDETSSPKGKRKRIRNQQTHSSSSASFIDGYRFLVPGMIADDKTLAINYGSEPNFGAGNGEFGGANAKLVDSAGALANMFTASAGGSNSSEKRHSAISPGDAFMGVNFFPNVKITDTNVCNASYQIPNISHGNVNMAHDSNLEVPAGSLLRETISASYKNAQLEVFIWRMRAILTDVVIAEPDANFLELLSQSIGLFKFVIKNAGKGALERDKFNLTIDILSFLRQKTQHALQKVMYNDVARQLYLSAWLYASGCSSSYDGPSTKTKNSTINVINPAVATASVDVSAGAELSVEMLNSTTISTANTTITTNAICDQYQKKSMSHNTNSNSADIQSSNMGPAKNVQPQHSEADKLMGGMQAIFGFPNHDTFVFPHQNNPL